MQAVRTGNISKEFGYKRNEDIVEDIYYSGNDLRQTKAEGFARAIPVSERVEDTQRCWSLSGFWPTSSL